MQTNLPTVAGFISTALFALGTLPMLTKAFRTKDLASYSLGNILLSNVGNLIYSIYVFDLPLRSFGEQVTTMFLRPLCCSSTL
jgi:uncharacterized protein with PQ loop repeat